jgi:Transglutaminase-like superfamily
MLTAMHPSLGKKLLLHRDVYACRTDDGAVFMDLRTGEYSALDLATTNIIAARIEGWIGSDSATADENIALNDLAREEILDSLTNDLSVLTDSGELGKTADLPVMRQTESIPFRGNLMPWPRIGAYHLAAFGYAYLRALFEVKCRPIAATIRRVQERKFGHGSGARPDLSTVDLVRIFRALRPFLYTAKDRCLFDSVALIEFLASFDVFPDWVIAVRTRPFAAHSWVVDGDLILNEQLERAEEFYPILVV